METPWNPATPALAELVESGHFNAAPRLAVDYGPTDRAEDPDGPLFEALAHAPADVSDRDTVFVGRVFAGVRTYARAFEVDGGSVVFVQRTWRGGAHGDGALYQAYRWDGERWQGRQPSGDYADGPAAPMTADEADALFRETATLLELS